MNKPGLTINKPGLIINKPLKDWTLGELKEYCDSQRCEECKFGAGAYKCILEGSNPCKWDLSEPPRWTAEDVKDAKAVKRVFPEAVSVVRIDAETVQLSTGNRALKHMRNNIFRSLKKGEAVTLQEILDAEGK